MKQDQIDNSFIALKHKYKNKIQSLETEIESLKTTTKKQIIKHKIIIGILIFIIIMFIIF